MMKYDLMSMLTLLVLSTYRN